MSSTPCLAVSRRETGGVSGGRRRLSLCALVLAAALFSGCAATNEEIVEKGGDEALFHRAMVYYQNTKLEHAEKDLKKLMDEYPLSKYALEAQLKLADIYYSVTRYEDANAYYTSFVAIHPSHPKAPYAQFQKGMCRLREVLSVDRDQTSTQKAIFSFEDVIARYPDSPYAGKARSIITFLRRRLAEREFYVGKFYFKDKNYKGALYRFSGILRDYPDAGITDKALYYLGKSYSRLGEEKRAKEVFARLRARFPDSPYAASGEK
ncbi:MAG TPA: outer membrane protein assembly factor BamD [Deltaproteobacteria bacterium]|nr:outer membrane protein assembly factor BamD [Deltaproteobacteria bacterium]